MTATQLLTIDQRLGQRIKATREQRCMNRKSLAAALEVSGPAVTHWESGRNRPAAETVTRIASILGVTSSYLLGADPRSDMGLPSTLDDVLAMAKLSAAQVIGVSPEQIEVEVRIKR